MDFFVIHVLGGAMNRPITISDSHIGYSLHNGTKKAPQFPVGGGAVVTNDWCIMSHFGTLHINRLKPVKGSHLL